MAVDEVSQSNTEGERGAALVEYMVLIGFFVLVLSFVLPAVSSAISSEFEEASTLLGGGGGGEGGDEGGGDCPTGWDLVAAGPTKKNGSNADANGDGLVCQKQIPGQGNGNTGQNTNIKDNN
jgi:Flp pilus assembly pilin Flp